MSDTPNGAASENATAPDDATVAIGRPRTTLDLAAAKLRTALQERSGYVVVTAESSAAAEALFATVEPRLTTFRTVRASGHGLDPEAIVRSLWRDGEPPFPARLAMRALIDEARAAARPIVVAITDADAAEPARLERVRLTLEGAPDASEIVRIALLGGPALIELLRQPGTRAVAMRIGATVQVPMTTADITPSRDVPAPAPPRGRAPAVAAILAAALGVVAWVLWPQAREPQPLPPRHEVPAAVPPPVALPVPPVGIEEPAADERVAAAPVAATPEAVAPANEPAPPVATPAPEPARPEPAPPAAAVAAPAPAVPFPPRGKAELQVGAFRKPESAEALRAKLAPQFPTVYVATTVRDGTTFHRVRVGGFRSAHDLGIAEAMLRSAGLEPARVASVPSPK